MPRRDDERSGRRRALTGLLLGTAGCLFFLLAPLGGMETVPARRMAAVAFLMASWWVSEALPLGATALLPMVLFPVLGILPAGRTTQQYGHHLIFLFLAGFLLARGLARWRLDRRLALSVVSLAGSNPRVIVLAMMAVTAFLSMWVSNSATAAMMMPVGLAIIGHAAERLRNQGHEVDTEPGRFRFGVSVMLGIAYAASIGGVGTIIGTPPNVLLMGMLEDLAGIRIGFARWMLIGIPLVLIMLPLVWAWLVFVAYRPEIDRLPGGRGLVREQLRSLGPTGSGGWLTAAVVVLTAIFWISRALWERWLVGAGVIGAGMVNDTSVGIFGAILLFLLPSRERAGERLLDRSVWKEIPWSVLLLFGGGLALAEGFEETGLARILGEGAVTISQVPLPLFVAAVCFVVISLTEFASNTASAAMILPLLAGAAATLGIPAPILMVPAAVAASMAFMMPAGTPPNAIVFGTGYVSIPQMVKAGVAANLIALVVILVASLVLVPRIF